MSTFIRGIGKKLNTFAVGSSNVKKMYIGSTKIYDKVSYDSKVAYLQGNGGQMIDTGISGGTNVEFEVDFQLLSQYKAWQHVFGSSVPPTAPKLYRDSRGYYVQYNGSNFISSIISLSDTSRHVFEYKDGKVYLDGTLKATVGNYGFGSSNFCVLGYYPEPGLCCYAKLYKCKVWKDGVLVRDMIPVRVGQVGYMFDKESEQLYLNVGSGSFTLGPDVQ